MIKLALTLLCYFISLSGYAELTQQRAHGFHWYSVDPIEKEQKIAPTQPSTAQASPYEQLMEVRKQTLNKLAQALIEPSFEATYDYMKAQQTYAKNNQKFVQHWQQVLLVHPELDYTLHFPTDNSAVAIRNDSQNQLIEKVIRNSTKTYGLILFYRGNSAISQKMVTHLVPFVNENHFSMISVTTDGQSINGLPNPRSIPEEQVEKTMHLKARYLPALFLVNLKTQKMSPLSYGFVSLTELKERFLDVATHFKRFSYEGLEES